MAQHYLIGFAMVLACFLLEVPARPSNNESMAPIEISTQTSNGKEDRSLQHEQVADVEETQDNTRDILDKIKVINEGLKKPYKQQLNLNNDQLNTRGEFVLDNEILEKLKDIIASGKLNGLSDIHRHQENNDINEMRYSRAMPFGLTPNILGGNQGAIPLSSVPYLTSIPVIVVPSMINGLPSNTDQNSIEATPYQTRQGPGLPFQVSWPLASYFPLLIKDPLVALLHGGGWNNFIEYGQSADVCNRKQKSVDENESVVSENQEGDDSIDISFDSSSEFNSRQGRALRKRTIAQSTPFQEIDNAKKSKKKFSTKLIPTRKPVKQSNVEEETEDTKASDPKNGDLRFPFGDFTWFGNRKPVAPSPGFFINRLKVRRGGVAIAGPGGVATAGRGGTAIVGPGGLAYTQPGGLAVAGPAARVVALSSDADLSSIVSRLQEQSANDGSVPRLLEAIPEGKVVATGPVVYYHPNEQT